MKCLILAGGRGERLWPLSRKNYPKQFIQVQNNHSVFQETVARNIPYCDEFIIVTNYEYRYIIENQMKAFQGTPYRCVYEEIPRKTTAAILLACFDLQPSEFVFVVASDHLIDTTGESVEEKLSYKDAILQAKEYAGRGAIALFGLHEEVVDERFGYIIGIDNTGVIKSFHEKPDKKTVTKLRNSEERIYRNLGMMLFQNGTLQKELSSLCNDVYTECRKAYSYRENIRDGYLLKENIQHAITPIAIEKSLLEKSNKIKAVNIGFKWDDIGSLEDLLKTELQTDGVSVENDCSNTVIINNSSKQAVVVNELDNVLVVNTPDAVYVGRKGKSDALKDILHENASLVPFSEKSTLYYRSWGMYETLIEEPSYRVRKVTLAPGKTIYSHKHAKRSEHWTITNGTCLVILNDKGNIVTVNQTIDIPEGMTHQISNICDDDVIFIETAIGEIQHSSDVVSDPTPDISESQLGIKVDPMVKLSPAFKDYLWGGTKLRDIYGKKCDFDIIAESWELSAHPDGQSTVISGKHKGLKFSEYINVVGKDVLGWKCKPLQSFPLLIKFIDAKGNLSVQVHPDDEYALEKENQYGKNEMWYVVGAEPGAGLYVGFNKDVSRHEVEQRIKDNTILEILNFYPTHPGDVFFIPAGTVHAIGEGNLICEIQQSSNCTYRLYDYDRRDKFGNPRELHLEKALDVLNFNKYEPVDFKVEKNSHGKTLSRCKYFESTVYEILGDEKIFLDDDRFYSIVCIKGNGTLNIDDLEMNIKAGETVFIPAQKNKLQVKGDLSLIFTHV